VDLFSQLQQETDSTTNAVIQLLASSSSAAACLYQNYIYGKFLVRLLLAWFCMQGLEIGICTTQKIALLSLSLELTKEHTSSKLLS
jgi:hypothetical protein